MPKIEKGEETLAMGSSIFLLFFYSLLLSLATLTLSQNDGSLMRRCNENGGNYAANSTYRANLNSIISQFSSLAQFNDGFFNLSAGESPEKVNTMALCMGDSDRQLCKNCLINTATELKQYCPSSKEATAWSEFCLVRYANRDMYGPLEDEHSICLDSPGKVKNPVQFNRALSELLNNLTSKAAAKGTPPKYAAGNVLNDTLPFAYAMVQCTPDMDEQNCRTCLSSAISQLQGCCYGMMRCRVLRPNCILRLDSYPFYYQIATAPPEPPPPSPTTISTPTSIGGNGNSTRTLIIIIASLVGILILSITTVCLFKRRKNAPKKAEKNIVNGQEFQLLELVGRAGNEYSNEIFQDESGVRSQEFPSIQLDILQAATEQFCNKNKLGEGGFGPVYKGNLADGKEIAVKRLSRTSGQGLLEFKNEIMLIAKLQHRNLVRLLGCCLERNEKLLVYEYMPNKSLDVFLFDSSIGVRLNWQKRLGIIKGIARGVLYLHEDFRLKIIHRDLKASNILLDLEMNPKISDFGMARIFCGNQNQASTNRVVGTYGYMAPEYAMEGLFSIKSDVFSFGVLLLEIISGKRNNGFHYWERGESLLTFAWKLWSKGLGMELVDPLFVQSCVANEALKCIHIGLLCVQEDPTDRPTMSSVVVMLESKTISLPLPTKPAFSIGRVGAEPTQFTSNNEACSLNEITISNMLPR